MNPACAVYVRLPPAAGKPILRSHTPLPLCFSIACALATALLPSRTSLAQTPADKSSRAASRSTLPIAPPPFRGKVARDYKTSIPQRNPPLRPPPGAPNILLVLLDDAGYGQTGTFGSAIPTPTLDALAARGLRYTRFHVNALCSPTRASLLTGRNNHAVGMGTITNWSSDYPGYNASIPKSAAFVSELLRENGYATAGIGKWHLIPDEDTTLAGPFDHWPTHEGFDYFYGFLGGETDQWHPELTEGTHPLELQPPPGRDADYTLNEDLAEHARTWIGQQAALAPDRPLFLYYAPGGTHAPLQAPKVWIDRFKGKFDMGWDRYRELVFARQKQLGVIPADALLTPRPPELPAWNSLSPDQQKVAARLMEVFAGFMAQTDFEVGRVIDALRQTGRLDNTLVLYIAGDNGASLEGGLNGTDNIMREVNGLPTSTAEMLAHLDAIGGPGTNPHYPVAWAWAGNTPFQWGKRIGSHLGGTRDPLVVAWPGHIPDPGGLRSQYTHVIDVLPTILEAAGLPAPTSVNGVPQQRIDGQSFLPTLADKGAPERHTTQYSEMHGNLSIYSNGWIAAQRSGALPWIRSTTAPKPTPWELYHLSLDYSEAHDLASANPAKLDELKLLFNTEAERNHVFPIDPRVAGREHTVASPPGGRPFFTFYPGATHLYDALAPATCNRSHTLRAFVNIPAGGANGVLVAEGGEAAGFSLYLQNGRPAYTYNYFGEHTTLTAADALPPGPATVEMRFTYDGGGRGKGARVVLLVNGKPAAQARLAHTVPVSYAYDETFDVGEDSASPVGPYHSPFPFAGTLNRLEVENAPPPALSLTDRNAATDSARRLADLRQ